MTTVSIKNINNNHFDIDVNILSENLSFAHEYTLYILLLSITKSSTNTKKN